MNKPSKSKAEGDPSTYNPMTEKEMASLRRDIFAESRANSDIISRMEATQQRFGSFPSLLVSAENERRLQLIDRERTFDGEDAEAWQEQSERQGAE